MQSGKGIWCKNGYKITDTDIYGVYCIDSGCIGSCNDDDGRDIRKVEEWKRFLKEEDAIETIEVAIITAILLGFALAFRERMLAYGKAIAERILGTT